MECLFQNLGFQPNKFFFIPVRDEQGLSQYKCLRIKEGGELHKKLIEMCNGKLPKYIQELNNKAEEP